MKQAFEGEYPKLLRLFNDLWRRLQQNKLDIGVSGDPLVTDESLGLVTDEQEMFASKQTQDIE